jgi:hypothetical protein
LRRQRFDEDRQAAADEARRAALAKEEEIQLRIRAAKEQEAAKAAEFERRQAAAQHRLALAQERERAALEEKKFQEELREQRRLEAKQLAEQEEELRKQFLIDRQEEQDKNVQRVHCDRRTELLIKQEEARLKHMEKMDNIVRIHRMQEYEREQKARKIDIDKARTEALVAKKQVMLYQRQQQRKQADIAKARIKDKLERVKQGTLPPSEISRIMPALSEGLPSHAHAADSQRSGQPSVQHDSDDGRATTTASERVPLAPLSSQSVRHGESNDTAQNEANRHNQRTHSAPPSKHKGSASAVTSARTPSGSRPSSNRGGPAASINSRGTAGCAAITLHLIAAPCLLARPSPCERTLWAYSLCAVPAGPAGRSTAAGRCRPHFSCRSKWTAAVARPLTA